MTETRSQFPAPSRRRKPRSLPSGKIAAAKSNEARRRMRAEIRREVKRFLPSLLDVVLSEEFGAALEASGELDACESGTESRNARRSRTVGAGKPQRAQRKTKSLPPTDRGKGK